MTVPTQARSDLETRAAAIAQYAERSLRDFNADEFREELEERIRGRPIASVLLAAGIGFVVGRLLRS